MATEKVGQGSAEAGLANLSRPQAFAPIRHWSSLSELNQSWAKPAIARFCLFGALILALSACHGRHEKVYIEDDEKDSANQLVSSFKMYESAAARQLTSGFYSLESNSWRWTGRDFVIDFKTPPAASARGATLSFNLVIPDVLIQKVPNVHLAATVHGRQIGEQHYTASGSYTFTAPIPPDLCAAPETVVNFHLEKAMPPSAADSRELGVIASAAALRTE